MMIKEISLLLLYLTAWNEEGLIVNNYKSKSLALTEAGETLAGKLYDKYCRGKNNE